jgi:putative transposase
VGVVYEREVDPVDADIKVIRRDQLGGLIHEYAQVA